jgi:3-deoxy-manno-octulosonate cytidylyltransferase (CMP-KDO synthetase)
LRWLENGYAIHLAITPNKTIGVDTPEDVDKIIAYLRAQSQK